MRPLIALVLLTALPLVAPAQTAPAKRQATTKPTPKATARPAANAGDATVAPGETVELGRASTDYNGRPSTYKKPARKPLPSDSPTLPGGQGSYAAPGQPVPPTERARDDYDGRPLPAAKPKPAPKPASSATTRP